ncbi:MAG: hypothetical protein KY475_00110 [Planctomycetes bacterium]|nr:hypothetical protein [Planctomycetota bacterium]
MRAIALVIALLIAVPASAEDAASVDAVIKSPAVAQNRDAKGKRGDASKDGKSDRSPREKKGMPPGVTPEREAAAMTFVRQHHAELVDLLRYLKDQQPAAYRQAILDLFRVSERLAQAQERDYDRYELELALWKAESRIELLAARLKMAGRDSPEGKMLLPQLKRLLEERHDLRMERLSLDRQRTLERLDRIEKQLETMEANRAQAIKRELTRLSEPNPK